MHVTFCLIMEKHIKIRPIQKEEHTKEKFNVVI